MDEQGAKGVLLGVAKEGRKGGEGAVWEQREKKPRGPQVEGARAAGRAADPGRSITGAAGAEPGASEEKGASESRNLAGGAGVPLPGSA